MAASAAPTSSTTNVSLPSSLSSTPCSRIACLAKRFLDDPGFLAGWPQVLLIGRGGLEWKSPWVREILGDWIVWNSGERRFGCANLHGFCWSRGLLLDYCNVTAADLCSGSISMLD